ncbi:MAG: alanine racemase [Planctomycetota bacterium]|nr:MAG: alanine racemase [Planctomycetota bacterium]
MGQTAARCAGRRGARRGGAARCRANPLRPGRVARGGLRGALRAHGRRRGAARRGGPLRPRGPRAPPRRAHLGGRRRRRARRRRASPRPRRAGLAHGGAHRPHRPPAAPRGRAPRRHRPRARLLPAQRSRSAAPPAGDEGADVTVRRARRGAAATGDADEARRAEGDFRARLREGAGFEGPPGARAWAELDLDAVRANARRIRRSAGVPLLAVVKADGYGHGAPAVARAALEGGASRLGVATAAEALALRQAGLTAPVQVLGSFLDSEADLIAQAEASFTLHEEQDLRRVAAAAWRAGRALPVHLKVDVGMGRHGVDPRSAARLLAEAQRCPGVRVAGLMTHLPCAGAPDPAISREQISAFARLVAWARREGLCPPQVHAAASAALFRFPEARFTQVRSGIAVLGLDPGGWAARADVHLRPALSLRARVMRTRVVARGVAVGYGGRWTARRPSRLALLGIGYGDGLPYGLSGRGAHALLAGRRCPIVGTVMMDYALVDASDLPRAPRPGDVATLVGRDGEGRILLEEQARKAGLIPYAFATGLGKRLQRVVRGMQLSPPARVRRAA